MLFWTKLLTIAHAATTSIHPYICLYYMCTLKFDTITIAMLTAVTLILKVPSSIFWTDLVDHRPSLHGVFTGLLTAIGTAGILLILSVPPAWIATAALPVAVISAIFDGLFYQPLEILVDSAIIKILGDYKILYGNERTYGKWVSAMMALGIGWSLDDDHDFDTLMVTLLIGSVALFLLSLSTTVQAADPSLLGVLCNEVDETTPLSKQHIQYTDTSSSYVYYKPYSLFGEQLSHISEEDASMLQRIATTNNSVSIRPLPRPASVCSASSRFTNNTSNYYHHSHLPSVVQPEYEDSACFFHPLLPPSHPASYHSHANHYSFSNNNFEADSSSPSFELARLPYPPVLSPAVVLITLLPVFNQRHSTNEIGAREEEYYRQCSIAAHHHQHQSKWIVKSFTCSMLCLGIVFGMTQSLLFVFLYDILKSPMHLIGIIGFIKVYADILASRMVIKIIQRFPLPAIIGTAYAFLILCPLAYIWLQPGTALTQLTAIALQFLQSISFYSVWLLATHQVDSVILADRKRMILKGGMAALFSGLGPAIGVLITGCLVSMDSQDGWSSVYQYAAGISLISAIFSWEWSTSD